VRIEVVKITQKFETFEQNFNQFFGIGTVYVVFKNGAEWAPNGNENDKHQRKRRLKFWCLFGITC